MSVTPDRATMVSIVREGMTSRMHQLGGLSLVALAVFPLVLSDILMLKFAGAMFFAVFAMSWDFVSGYTGYISFGHAVFFGAAGYGSAILNAQLGMDPLITIPIGILCAIIVGILIGVPTLRIEGPYLSLVTLVAPLLLLQIFIYYREYTGGQRGLFGVETIWFDPMTNYYVAFVVLLAALAISLAFTRSNVGTIMKAISGDEEIVSASGLNPAKYKIFAFVMSAGIGGFAGAIFTHTAVGSATPSLLLGLLVSANVIIATVLGGMGTITGSALGGFAFFLAREFLRNIEETVPIIGWEFNQLYLILLFFLAMVVIIYLPNGFVPWLKSKIEGDGQDPAAGSEAIPDGGRSQVRRAIDKNRRMFRTTVRKKGDDEY